MYLHFLAKIEFVTMLSHNNKQSRQGFKYSNDYLSYNLQIGPDYFVMDISILCLRVCVFLGYKYG